MNEKAVRLGGVPEHFNLPWHLALESGELDGVAATWEDQPGGTGEMLQKLEAGELDVVSILTEGTVAAIEGGARLTIIQVYVESPLQWGVHVPAASDLTSEADLDGCRIAISRYNSGSHLMAFVQAERNGWTIDPSQFVVVGGLDGARDHFADLEADLFLWDRFMTQPLVDSGEFRRLGIQPTPWPSFVIAARTETLTGCTTAVGRIVDAVVKQATGLHARDDIVELLTTRYRLSHETVTEWLDTTTFAPRAAFDPATHQNTVATLRRAGLLG